MQEEVCSGLADWCGNDRISRPGSVVWEFSMRGSWPRESYIYGAD